MISRSAPSYSPTARARVTANFCSEQFRQYTLARGNGSPQLSQIGGVMGRIDRQQRGHTHPDSGASRRSLQTAHAGASSAVTNASTTLTGIRDLRLGISGVTVVTLSGAIRFQTQFQRFGKAVQQLVNGVAKNNSSAYDVESVRTAPRLHHASPLSTKVG